MKLYMKVRPRGENYSTSRGSYCARMVNLGVGSEGGNQGGYDRYLYVQLDVWKIFLVIYHNY